MTTEESVLFRPSGEFTTQRITTINRQKCVSFKFRRLSKIYITESQY